MAPNVDLRAVLPVLLVVAAVLAAPPALAQKFYPDDPLTAEPPPYPTFDPQARALSGILELVSNTVGHPGERHPDNGVIESGGVNTMGEVLDGPWFVNRHAARRLMREELMRGVGTDHAPMADGPWRVLSVKPYGVRPGILLADGRDALYLLIFDPPDNLEMSTGAQMVSSRIAHAIGYHVAESYIVTFERGKLVVGEGGRDRLERRQHARAAGEGSRRVPARCRPDASGALPGRRPLRLSAGVERLPRPVSAVHHPERRSERHRAARASSRPAGLVRRERLA